MNSDSNVTSISSTQKLTPFQPEFINDNCDSQIENDINTIFLEIDQVSCGVSSGLVAEVVDDSCTYTEINLSNVPDE